MRQTHTIQLKVQKKRNMLKKRLPAIVDRAVWEKVTYMQARIRWDSVVESMEGYWRKLRIYNFRRHKI